MKNIIHKIKNRALSGKIFWVIINIVLTRQAFALEGETSILPNPLGDTTTFSGLILKIADIVFKVGFPIAVIFIIYSGLLFVTARGNEEKLKTAKRTFLWAILGTAILLGAVVIAEAIKATIESF